MVDERGRATGEAEGVGCGALLAREQFRQRIALTLGQLPEQPDPVVFLGDSPRASPPGACHDW